MPAKRKQPEAMVKPPPSSPKTKRTKPPQEVPSLPEVLYRLGQDRAYVVLWSKVDEWGGSWKVHFEGDLKSVLIIFKDGKAVMEKD